MLPEFNYRSPPDFLQTLQIVTKLGVKSGGSHLSIPAILVILLPIQEPVWDLERAGVGYDDHDALQLCSTELTSPKSNAKKLFSDKPREQHFNVGHINYSASRSQFI